jgi:ATP synthase protein I
VPEDEVPDPGDGKRRAGDDEGLSDLARGYQKAAPYLSASTQLVVSVMLFTGLGYLGDRYFGHRVMWMLMAGALVGMVVGFVGFFRAVLGKR